MKDTLNMHVKDIEDPIATRKLEMGRDEVIVTIGKPKFFEGDYFCPYSIEYTGNKKVGRSFGVDAVQALQLTMKKIGVDLLHLSETKGIPISLFPDTPNDTGFPTE
jgi:hypothetical protein